MAIIHVSMRSFVKAIPPSLLCSISLFFLLVCVALKFRFFHIPPPPLCRFAVFLIQTNVLSSANHPPIFSDMYGIQVTVASDSPENHLLRMCRFDFIVARNDRLPERRQNVPSGQKVPTFSQKFSRIGGRLAQQFGDAVLSFSTSPVPSPRCAFYNLPPLQGTR